MKPKEFKKQKNSFNLDKNFSEICKIQESETLKMNAIAIALKAEGRRIFNLSAGEPKVNIWLQQTSLPDYCHFFSCQKAPVRKPPAPVLVRICDNL